VSIEEKLESVLPDVYGEDCQAHRLEQYRLYVESADRISDRRQSANSFFLAVNTLLVTMAGYVAASQPETTLYAVFSSCAGMLLCYTWYRLIRSYRGLNTGKFEVIHLMERRLPFAPYSVEWEALGSGKDPKRYLPFTAVEKWVPLIFLLLHVVAVLAILLGSR
jgi:hypothetical protein